MYHSTHLREDHSQMAELLKEHLSEVLEDRVDLSVVQIEHLEVLSVFALVHWVENCVHWWALEAA